MNFLFEIGIEELPARYVNQAEEDLKQIITQELSNERIKFMDIRSFSTPRRFSVIVENISEKQEDLDKKSIGPSINVAYKDGVLTKAGEGFVKSQNATIDDIKVIENEKGQYISVEQFIKGIATKDVLPQILDTVLRKIEFEKNMKWSDKEFRFARPIKWFVTLLNGEILPFEFEGIKSSNVTRGMRIFASQNLVLENESDYEKMLEGNVVIPSREKRKQAILDSVHNNCEQDGDRVVVNDYLLEEVVNLVEYPYAIKGEFSADYLSLPEDIITITMETHQRYFPVLDENGKLTNKFVLVRNANEYSEIVKKGNEKVIEPRLADAKFFFDEDLKTKFEENTLKLKEVVFQKDMGTIYEKVERSLEIAKYIINELKLQTKEKNILRTIELAKADLVTNVIGEKEFTKLQGFMGQVYAEKQGEDANVAKGIFEHYLPRYQGDKLPETLEGAIAGISDKIDTVVGCFAVGLKPTSSKDPYALRRAVQGIIMVALEMKLNINYEELILKVLSIFAKSKKVKESNVEKEIIEFFKQRLVNVLSDRYSKDLISYEINLEKNITELEHKLSVLAELSKTDEFDRMVNLLKRVKNIIKDEKISGIDVKENLFEKEEEKKLMDFIKKFEDSKEKSFDNKTRELLHNSVVIDDFFDNVMINSENQEVKHNRLEMLSRLMKLIDSIVSI
ncbi:MAG: glycine--tRNA ligase subunit beta [Leptotrichiaceae bacterium]|nr:glycine--tRNA ligase subunit beta [Leptotrichiaceae bacterium]